jgi:hypothetical protein
VGWGEVRRAVTFALGIATVLDGLFSNPKPVGELVVGAVLLGVIPFDTIADAYARRRNGR